MVCQERSCDQELFECFHPNGNGLPSWWGWLKAEQFWKMVDKRPVICSKALKLLHLGNSLRHRSVLYSFYLFRVAQKAFHRDHVAPIFLRPKFYKWYFPSVCLSVCPSVCLSVCHTFFTMFPSSYHHEIFRSYYHGQKWCPCKRSRSEVKGQGHRGQHPT